MKAYWVCVYEKIDNAEKLKEYAVKAKPAIEKFSGKFLVRGGKNRTNDGIESPRTVVVEFPDYSIAVESFSGKGIEDQQGELIFSREMSSTVQDMKGNILLCDDLSDTGVTLNKSIEWLKNYPPLKGNIKNIKTAVLWKKKDSTFEPDFCAQKLNSNPWIVQPFERYEEVRVEDLIKKHKS